MSGRRHRQQSEKGLFAVMRALSCGRREPSRPTLPPDGAPQQQRESQHRPHSRLTANWAGTLVKQTQACFQVGLFLGPTMLMIQWRVQAEALSSARMSLVLFLGLNSISLFPSLSLP